MTMTIDFVHPWIRTVVAVARAKAEPKRLKAVPPQQREALDPLGRRWAVILLMPAGHPPCFSSQASWDDYMQQAAVTPRTDGPLRIVAGQLALNTGFSYCEDCMSARQAEMAAAGRCEPGFMKG